MARNTLTQDNPTLAQVVNALRESVDDGSMLPTSQSLVLAAAKARNVPIKDGRVLDYQRRAGDLYFGVRALIERGGVRVGQRWASKAKRDINRTPPRNQRREVVMVDAGWAFLTSDRVSGAYGVRIKHGAVDRHRLVEDVA